MAKVKVTKKTISKSPEIAEEEIYWECQHCGYQDNIGGTCPNCDYPDMEFRYPKKYKSLAEYLLGDNE